MNEQTLLAEGYKTIDGCTSYYINNDGYIYSLKSKTYRKLYPNSNGYLSATIYSDIGKRRTVFPHRLVCDIFVENPYNYNWVLHKDGNRQNNHHSNLEFCKFNIAFQKRKKRKKPKQRISFSRRIEAFWQYFLTFNKDKFTKIYKTNPRVIELAILNSRWACNNNLKEEELIYFKFCEGASYEQLCNHGLTEYRVRTSIFKSRKKLIQSIEEHKDNVTFPQLHINIPNRNTNYSRSRLG